MSADEMSSPDVHHPVGGQRLLRLLVGDHLHADHEALAADVADDLEVAPELLQTLEQVGAYKVFT
jgi:hypothetical protein